MQDKFDDKEAEGIERPASVMAHALTGIGKAGAVGLVLMAIYTAGIGLIPFTLHRSYALALSAIVVVLCGKNLVASAQTPSPLLRIVLVAIDIAMIAVLVWAILIYPTVLDRIESEFSSPTLLEMLLSFGGLAAILELCRRIWGLPLFLVCLTFLAYLVFGEYLPEVVAHRPITWEALSMTLWFGYQGVFSTMLNIVLNVVIIYVFFGTLLETTGAGDVLLKFAFAITGRSRGGPAHAAILSSSLFGSMSGSTVANVVGTGTFTIPMMKKHGFPPEVAGGVEATASSGGQIVPPVMGAAAFVMADLIGMPYLTIALAAMVPAALYYFNLVLSVIFEARKRDIQPIPRDERPKIERMDYVQALQFLVPVAVVIGVMLNGRSVAFAGLCATAMAILMGFLVNPTLRREPYRILRAAIAAGRNAASVIIAVAVMGVIIGTMDATGAGLKFAIYIEYLGSGNLFLSLLLAMIGALMLGMGMPTLPAYLIIILVLGPAIEVMGLSALSAHMFVFYYGVASSITPPVALAAYAAAPIAGANPLKTGLMAVRLGMAKFLVPFIFVYNPVLLLVEQFDVVTFALALSRTALAFWMLASALARFERSRLSTGETWLRALAGILLLLAWGIPQVLGALLAIALLFFHSRRHAANKDLSTQR